MSNFAEYYQQSLTNLSRPKERPPDPTPTTANPDHVHARELFTQWNVYGVLSDIQWTVWHGKGELLVNQLGSVSITNARDQSELGDLRTINYCLSLEYHRSAGSYKLYSPGHEYHRAGTVTQHSIDGDIILAAAHFDKGVLIHYRARSGPFGFVNTVADVTDKVILEKDCSEEAITYTLAEMCAKATQHNLTPDGLDAYLQKIKQEKDALNKDVVMSQAKYGKQRKWRLW